MKKDFTDVITLFIKRAIDFLILKYPYRTSLGVVIGLALKGLSTIFADYFINIGWINFNLIDMWIFIVLGLCISHFPNIKREINTMSIHDEKIEEIISLIEKGCITKEEKREYYARLINLLINEYPKKIDSTREK